MKKRKELMQSISKSRMIRRNYVSIIRLSAVSKKMFLQNHQLLIRFVIRGETSRYNVDINFPEFDKYLPFRTIKYMKYSDVISQLSKLLNDGVIKVRCTCPDFQYRVAAVATEEGYIFGKPELRPITKVTPESGCKHLALVLSRLGAWLMSLSKEVRALGKLS